MAANITSEGQKISNSKENEKTAAQAGADTVEVLYQNLGGRWYAFSIIDDEVFMGSINPESLHSAEIGR